MKIIALIENAVMNWLLTFALKYTLRFGGVLARALGRRMDTLPLDYANTPLIQFARLRQEASFASIESERELYGCTSWRRP